MDASVGLTFSLQLFQRYRRSGVLQARVHHIPGVQGNCTAYVHLTAGSVTSCYLKNEQGQQISFSLEKLSQIDNERGPFQWIFQAQQPASGSQIPASQSAQPQASGTQIPVSQSAQPLPRTPPSPAELDTLIPKVVASLRWEQFNDWTPEQRLLLQHVWKSIDGQHTIQDMKAGLPYPPQLVNEILQILLTLRIIVLTS